MTTQTPHVTEVKDLFGGETKVLDRQDGVVEAVVSVTGVDDQVDDRIRPGAYAKTLSLRKPKGIRNHDWNRPAMKTLAVDELHPGDPGLPSKTARGERWPRSAGALKVLMQYNLETKDGAEGFSNVQFYGPEQEWSIGYNVPRGSARMVKGIREIETMELYEYSDVLFGAAPLTGTQSVKALGGMVVGGPGLWLPQAALPGSYEERAFALERAVRDEAGDDKGWEIVATFEDRVLVAFVKDGEPEEWEYEYEILEGEALLGDREAPDEKRRFTQRQRERAPHQPGTEGSFPISNVDDLDNAIRALGRSKDPEATRRWIIQRARELNAVSHLPKSWGVEKAVPAPAEEKALDTDPDPSPNRDATRLRNYWAHGEGAAKIGWGTPGDFDRCVGHLAGKVSDPKGLCNVYHRAALGAPPGQGHGKAADEDVEVKAAREWPEWDGITDVVPPLSEDELLEGDDIRASL